jgi:maltose O-acetyltransferase
VGSPARVICTLDAYLEKERERMAHAPCYGEEYTLRKDVSMQMRLQQKEELLNKIGYID